VQLFGWEKLATVSYRQINTAADPNGVRYRTDCSGYVSMACKSGKSLNTITLPNVSRTISKAELKAGDVLCNCGPNRDPGQYDRCFSMGLALILEIYFLVIKLALIELHLKNKFNDLLFN
jgi:hypothetical protein